MSAAIEICYEVSDTPSERPGRVHADHVETFVRILPALLARGTVDSCPLAVGFRGFVDTRYRVLQFVVHCAVEDRVSDVVAEIKGTDE